LAVVERETSNGCERVYREYKEWKSMTVKQLKNDNGETLNEWLWKVHPDILMEFMHTIKDYNDIVNRGDEE